MLGVGSFVTRSFSGGRVDVLLSAVWSDSEPCPVCLQRFSTFLLENHDRKVCEDDQKEFLNGWYVLVIVSDLLSIIGSVLKIEIQAKVKKSEPGPTLVAVKPPDPPPFPPVPLGSDQLRRVQHLSGDVHAAGVGQRDQVPGVL